MHAQAPTSPLLELSKQFLAAAKGRDAAKVASFYAEDAVLMSPNAPPISRRLDGDAEAPTDELLQNGIRSG